MLIVELFPFHGSNNMELLTFYHCEGLSVVYRYCVIMFVFVFLLFQILLHKNRWYNITV